MKKTLKLLGEDFQSSSVLTPQFAHFYAAFTNELKKFLKDKGCTDIDFSRGHFYIYGFFTTADNKIYYINFGDVRWPMGSKFRMMYGLAEDYADYSGHGGPNQYVEINQLDNWSIFRK